MAAFAYEALEKPSEQIRLLRVQDQGQEDDAILSILETHDLDSAPPYMALSYMWGSPEPVSYITVSGRRFAVRQNACSALQLSRTHFANAALYWIDSICINQDNLDEKAEQVSIMGAIYRRAKNTLACLSGCGPVHPALTGACRALDDTFIAAVKSHDWKTLPADVTSSAHMGIDVNTDWIRLSELGNAFVKSLSTADTAALKDAVLLIASNRYWTRAWIVQEWLLSENPTILVETHRMQWRSYFALFLATCFNITEVLPSLRTGQPGRQEGTARDSFLQIATEMCLHTRKSSIQIVTSKFGKSQCADTRDHIYAFLAVIDWSILPYRVVPDYRISRFELAMRVVPEVLVDRTYLGERYVPSNALLHAEELLRILRVNACDKRVSEGIKARRVFLCRKLMPPLQGEIEEPWRWAFECSRTVRLSRRLNGNFYSSLKMAPANTLTHLFKGCKAFDTDLNSHFAACRKSKEDGPRLLMHGANVVGLLCQDAKDDDILVEILKDGPRTSNSTVELPYMKLYLVLREDKESGYVMIVGQTVLLRDIEECPGCEACTSPSRSNDLPQGFQLRVALSLEDLVVWLAQDLEVDEQDRLTHYIQRVDIGVCGAGSWSSLSYDKNRHTKQTWGMEGSVSDE